MDHLSSFYLYRCALAAYGFRKNMVLSTVILNLRFCQPERSQVQPFAAGAWAADMVCLHPKVPRTPFMNYQQEFPA
jgi:hypothetical protein